MRRRRKKRGNMRRKRRKRKETKSKYFVSKSNFGISSIFGAFFSKDLQINL